MQVSPAKNIVCFFGEMPFVASTWYFLQAIKNELETKHLDFNIDLFDEHIYAIQSNVSIDSVLPNGINLLIGQKLGFELPIIWMFCYLLERPVIFPMAE